jgi:hypothetical protein
MYFVFPQVSALKVCLQGEKLILVEMLCVRWLDTRYWSLSLSEYYVPDGNILDSVILLQTYKTDKYARLYSHAHTDRCALQ